MKERRLVSAQENVQLCAYGGASACGFHVVNEYKMVYIIWRFSFYIVSTYRVKSFIDFYCTVRAVMEEQNVQLCACGGAGPRDHAKASKSVHLSVREHGDTLGTPLVKNKKSKDTRRNVNELATRKKS